MTDKTLYTLRLGGNDVTLKFRMGALRTLRSLLGEDPIKALAGADISKAIDMALEIVKAGYYNGGGKATPQEVEQWFDDLMPVDVPPIVQAFIGAFAPDSPVEGNADTQGQAAGSE